MMKEQEILKKTNGVAIALWCLVVLVMIISNIEALSSFGQGFIKGFFSM